ncbi:hypothetical protein D9611_014845 [Ephemerocybe angulata]|uniref:Uncharacterized protein n=1 Tax=Ephemerocybe angulata TaxID=980116 RepID=A0A8H5BSJ9_9AGAR|nr:hypothetical protein D9611_014845 [Tulosesus angulatus]
MFAVHNMATSPPAPSPVNQNTTTFEHKGRTLILTPGKPLLAYALHKEAPPFPIVAPTTQPQNRDEAEDVVVHHGGGGSGDEEDGEEDEEESDEEPDWLDPPEPVEWGYIDEDGVGHGLIDLVWAFEGVPSYDGVNYCTLSEESERLMEAIRRVNSTAPTPFLQHGLSLGTHLPPQDVPDGSQGSNVARR